MNQVYGPRQYTMEYVSGSEECSEVDHAILELMEDLFHRGVVMVTKDEIERMLDPYRPRIRQRLWYLVKRFGSMTERRFGKDRVYSLSKDYIHDHCHREGRH